MNPSIMSNLASIERDDTHFVQKLRASQVAVWRVAEFLGNRFGYTVMVPALKVRPRFEDREAYSDCGDLFVSMGTEPMRRVEVKRRSLEFSGSADYPYPTVFVSLVKRWNESEPKPAAYVILNQQMTVAALVKGSTAHRWQQTERMDTVKNMMIEVFECPLDCVEFFPLDTT